MKYCTHTIPAVNGVEGKLKDSLCTFGALEVAHIVHEHLPRISGYMWVSIGGVLQQCRLHIATRSV